MITITTSSSSSVKPCILPDLNCFLIFNFVQAGFVLSLPFSPQKYYVHVNASLDPSQDKQQRRSLRISLLILWHTIDRSVRLFEKKAG
jgi:hypothetical protein